MGCSVLAAVGVGLGAGLPRAELLDPVLVGVLHGQGDEVVGFRFLRDE